MSISSRRGPAVLASALLAISGVGTPTAIAATTHSYTRITGRVTDAAGHPLAGVLVGVSTAVGFVGDHTARTDAHGRYAVASVPGPQFVTVDGSRARGGTSDSTGYYGGVNAIVYAHYGRTTAGVDAVLRPAGAVRGLVTDAAGHPLTGVVAEVIPIAPYVNESGYADFSPVSGTSTPTTRDGHFRITGVTPGAYQLCFDATGTVTGGTAGVRGYEPSCGSTVVASSGGRVSTAPTTALAETGGATVTGFVHGPRSRPVAGVEVDLQDKDTGYSTTTTATGVYRITDIAAGSYQVCFRTFAVQTATATGWAPVCLRTKLVIAGTGAHRLNRALTPGAAVSGRIVGANGTGLAGVPVSGDWNDGLYGDEPQAVTDDAGHYLLKNLPTAMIDLLVQSDFSSAAGPGNATGGIPDGGTVRAAAGKVRSAAVIRLTSAGGVSGVVRGSDGKPLSEVGVELDSDNAEYGNEGAFYSYTDTHGRYTATDLPPGRYSICYSNVLFYERCTADNITVRRGAITTGVNALLNTHYNKLAIVVEDSSGRRLAGAEAALFQVCSVAANSNCVNEPLAGGLREQGWYDVTDAAGSTHWQGVPTGSYQLCIYGYYASTTAHGAPATGYRNDCAARVASVTVTASSDQRVVVRLGDAGEVRGRVTDQNGKPIADVRVHVSGSAADDFADSTDDEAPTPIWDAYTDSDGNYAIRSVAPGQQTVCFDTTYLASVGGSYAPQCRGAAPGSTTGGTKITVTADATLSGVDISLASKTAVAHVAPHAQPRCAVTPLASRLALTGQRRVAGTPIPRPAAGQCQIAGTGRVNGDLTRVPLGEPR